MKEGMNNHTEDLKDLFFKTFNHNVLSTKLQTDEPT